MERGLEPSYVPGFAMAVTTTLLLFVLWAAVSWILRIAPVLAMSRGLGAVESLRAAVRLGPLKSKLIEINLVMGIVKVALIVLAMVFSACPLPFESVESQTFLDWWWSGCWRAVFGCLGLLPCRPRSGIRRAVSHARIVARVT